MLKILLKIIAGIVVCLLFLVGISIVPIDKHPYKHSDFYEQWKGNINNAIIKKKNEDFLVGWAKVNFTPSYTTPLAGYGVRRGKHFTAIHDSVFVRAIAINNYTIVSADLLIIPPNVTALVKQKLAKHKGIFENVYFGATHSHNSIGGWGNSIAGELFAGKYKAENVTLIVDAIVKAILDSHKNQQPANISYGIASDSVNVRNRLIDNGLEDVDIRNLRFNRQDGSTAMLCTYAAHATILSSDNVEVSRDYPGQLVDSLEDHHTSFAMYMAGAVGSMGPQENTGKTDADHVRLLADGVENTIQNMPFKPVAKAEIQMLNIPLPLREPNLRISATWRVRPWVFKQVFGNDYAPNIRALRMGNTLMIGLPCDFSGEFMPELSHYAAQKGLNLVCTSFNGSYIGYVIPDEYYPLDKYEPRTMSWFGFDNGAYFEEVIKDVIDKMAQ